jgi:hypothetical protein
MNNDTRLQTDPGSLVLVDDEEIRPRTDLSSISDSGFRTNPGSQTSGFSSTFVSRLLSVQLCSQFSARSIDRDSLVRVRTLYPVSSIVSSLVSRLVFTQYEPK